MKKLSYFYVDKFLFSYISSAPRYVLAMLSLNIVYR